MAVPIARTIRTLRTLSGRTDSVLHDSTVSTVFILRHELSPTEATGVALRHYSFSWTPTSLPCEDSGLSGLSPPPHFIGSAHIDRVVFSLMQAESSSTPSSTVQNCAGSSTAFFVVLVTFACKCRRRGSQSEVPSRRARSKSYAKVLKLMPAFS